jgi:lipopolysaccharide biosynthesis glycosyltransferase
MMSKKVLVTLANYDYIEYSKSLFESAKLSGKWDGDFVLIVPEEDKDKIDKSIFDKKGINVYFGKTLIGNPEANFYKIYLLDKYFQKWDWIFYTDLDVLFFNKIELDLNLRDEKYLYANPDGLSFINQFYNRLDWGISPYNLPFNNDKINLWINPKSKIKEIPKEISKISMKDCNAFQSCFMLFNTRFIELKYFQKLYDSYKIYFEYFNQGKSHLRDQPIFNLVFYKKWKYLNDKFINRYPIFDKINWDLKLLDSGYLDNTDYSDIIALHFFRWFTPWNKNNLRFYPVWKEYNDKF